MNCSNSARRNTPTLSPAKNAATALKPWSLLAIAALALIFSAMNAHTQTPADALSASSTPSPSDWTQFLRDNMQRWNPSETKIGVANAGNLGLKWSASYSDADIEGEYSSPAVVNGVVYLGSSFHVIAMNASTGAQLWNNSSSVGHITSSPAVANGVVYVSDDAGNVYALDTNTGAQRWSYDMGSNPMISSPALTNAAVYVSGNNGTLFALNAASGAKLWSHDIGGLAGFEFHTVASSPAVANGVVYIGGGDGSVYALNAATGAPMWRFDTGKGNNGPVTGSPAVANGVVYIGAIDGNVYALNATTGSELWQHSSPVGGLATAAAVANGLVYFTVLGGSGAADIDAYALNASTGDTVWSYGTGDFKPWFSSPAVANGVVYFGSLTGGMSKVVGYLYALNATTGALLWKYPTASQVRSSPAVVDGTVYFHASQQFLAFAPTMNADLNLRATSAPTPVMRGQLLTYTFPVWNLGPGIATHEVLTTQVPAGTTFDYIHISGTPGLGTCTTPRYQGTGPIVCHENSSMAANTTWTIRLTVQVTAPSGTVIKESATATEDSFDPNLANNTATVSNTVQ